MGLFIYIIIIDVGFGLDWIGDWVLYVRYVWRLECIAWS